MGLNATTPNGNTGHLVSFHDRVTHLVGEGKAADVAYSKAFDTVSVSHSILLEKLQLTAGKGAPKEAFPVGPFDMSVQVDMRREVLGTVGTLPLGEIGMVFAHVRSFVVSVGIPVWDAEF